MALTKGGENCIALTIKDHAGLMPQSLRATIGRKTIDLFFTMSLESWEPYLTTGILLYKHLRFFLPAQYFRTAL